MSLEDATLLSKGKNNNVGIPHAEGITIEFVAEKGAVLTSLDSSGAWEGLSMFFKNIGTEPFEIANNSNLGNIGNRFFIWENRILKPVTSIQLTYINARWEYK